MTVEEYLRYHTDVGDLVEFTRGGWRIGITYIDSEDLFLKSLNRKMLEAEVEEENHNKPLYVGSRDNYLIINIPKSIEINY